MDRTLAKQLQSTLRIAQNLGRADLAYFIVHHQQQGWLHFDSTDHVFEPINVKAEAYQKLSDINSVEGKLIRNREVIAKLIVHEQALEFHALRVYDVADMPETVLRGYFCIAWQESRTADLTNPIEIADAVEISKPFLKDHFAVANYLLTQDMEMLVKLFAAAVEKTYDSIIVTTAELNAPGPEIIYVNPGFTHLTGYSPEEVIGKTPRILQGPDTNRRVLQRLRSNLEAGEPFHGEAINYRKDGKPYHLEWNITPVRNNRGVITYFVAMQRNVTRYYEAKQQLEQANDELELRVRKRTVELLSTNARLRYEMENKEEIEKALRDSEKRHRIVSEMVSDLATSFYVDDDGRIQNEWIAGGYARVLGGVPKHIEEYGWDKPIFIPDLAIVQTAMRDVWQGKTVTIEFRVVGDAGELIWIESNFRPEVSGGNQRVHRFYVAAKDVTARKVAEEKQARQAEELSTLGRMGAAVVSQLDLNEVLKEVVENTRMLLPTADISLLLVEDKELVFGAVSGDNDSLLGMRFPLHMGLSGKVLQANEPINLFDEGEISNLITQAESLRQAKAGVRAFMAVPLKLGDEPLGVMEAMHKEVSPFTDEDLRLLQSAATWAAIAIDNAHRHTALQRQLREIETMSSINRAINSTLDLQQILQQIVDAADRLLPHVTRTVIHLLDETSQLLIPVAVAGYERSRKPEQHFRVGEGLAGLAFDSQTAVYTPDIRQDNRFVEGPAVIDLRSMMAVPIQRADRALGTITVQAAEIDELTNDDQKILERLCDNAATALENARLFQAEMQQRQFAEGLSTAVSILGQSALNEREVLTAVLTQTMKVTECSAAHILLFDQYTNDIVLADCQMIPEYAATSDIDGLTRIDSDFLKTFVDTVKPFNISSAGLTEDDWYALVPYTWVRSFAGAPLRVGMEAVGAIYVCSDKTNYFTTDMMQWLQAFAGQASIAMQNARLYQNLEDALRKEKAARDQMVRTGKLAAMGRMVASVAHELNNPLQIIKNCLYLLQVEVPSSPSVEEYLTMSLSEVTRLSELVLQLREVYRPRPSKIADVPIINLLHEVHLLVRTHLKQHKVTWQWPADTFQHEYIVQGNHDQLKQVMLNLSLNAIEIMAVEGGGTLHVSFLLDEELIGIKIQDTGKGIDPQDLNSLFDPFFTTKENGMGLGLAICHDIVQHHEGRIDIESRLGQGAIFTVWLPVMSVVEYADG